MGLAATGILVGLEASSPARGAHGLGRDVVRAQPDRHLGLPGDGTDDRSPFVVDHHVVDHHVGDGRRPGDRGSRLRCGAGDGRRGLGDARLSRPSAGRHTRHQRQCFGEPPVVRRGDDPPGHEGERAARRASHRRSRHQRADYRHRLRHHDVDSRTARRESSSSMCTWTGPGRTRTTQCSQVVPSATPTW